ncbi:hypothetical protein A5712_03585 [Mycobacterium sp. E2327]|uniref:hypothetical protein n=1 Tax=Mycobacterium sp. E2327 TaxID=1834132 RepID=UPI0007FFD8DB|nr:hypothetical protein [Mycobacterium sp. E2327]OBI14296.1 hypothetical protein A5712_03585 [Mycobacterium sp. E2327]
MTPRPETSDAVPPDTADTFDAVVSAWAESVRCESAYGCERPASWLALRHQPCGGHQPVCTFHYRKWVRASLARIGRSGRMRCIYCGQNFKTVEQCMCFRPL